MHGEPQLRPGGAARISHDEDHLCQVCERQSVRGYQYRRSLDDDNIRLLPDIPERGVPGGALQ